MIKTVFAKVLFEATHNWPGCDINEVSYLKNEHRHVFHITAYAKIDHDDREIEFIVLKHRIEEWLLNRYPKRQLGSKSCEMLALEIMAAFGLSKCIVSEDGENGVEITA